MADTTKQRAGRSYTVDDSGISSLKREYIVIQDAVMNANGEVVTFPGVPAIGSAHPNFPGLKVKSYDVREGTGTDKQVLTVEVNYGPEETEDTDPEDEDAPECAVDEWGWNDGMDERELVTDVDGVSVMNSAGDPFESVPKVSTPAPVFTKVMRFKTRQSGWSSYHCKVNTGAVTIGGVEYPACTLLCSIGEKRIIGNTRWKYQYTVNLRFKSNKVDIGNTQNLTEIGWDVAVTDAGMRELDDNGDKKVIRVMDKETGKMCAVTSAAPLDGQGHKNEEGYNLYNFRFKAYERTTFPSWFYSEPNVNSQGQDTDPNDGNNQNANPGGGA